MAWVPLILPPDDTPPPREYSEHSVVLYHFIVKITFKTGDVAEDIVQSYTMNLKDAKEFATWSSKAVFMKDFMKVVSVHVEDYYGKKIGFVECRLFKNKPRTVWVQY